MTTPNRILEKLIRNFGNETGKKKFKEALEIRARENIKLEDAAVRVGEGKLKRDAQIKQRIKQKQKNRSNDPERPTRFKDGVIIEQGGAPGSGKRS